MKLRFSLFLFTIVFPISAFSQIAIQHYVAPSQKADSLDIKYYSKKNGVRAGVMSFGLNMGIWGFDRFIMKEDFAYINLNSIKNNFKHGFVWDNDQMGTNMFLHPYHGSLYYNSARSNGYNYWASGLFALGGSAMWELFMENEYPSINDIIATPIGGMALGEMFYRVTDLILDDRKQGKARFGRELASFVISPTRGLTRIINGDAWKRRNTSGKQFGVPEVNIMVSSGLRALELKDEIFDKGTGFATEINIEYGNRFDLSNNSPYDYFSFKANLNVHSKQPILSQLNVVGRLTGIELIDNDKRHLSLGAYQHFDYYDSDTISDVSARIPYKICTPASIGVGLIYKMKLTKNWDFDAFSHFNGILLGGALSDYYKVDNRNYNLASGFSSKNIYNLVYKKDKFSVSAFYEMYRMFTWKGYAQDINWDEIDVKTFNAQGDHSQAMLHVFGVRVDCKILKQIYLTGIYNNYTRDTNYKYYDDVFSKTSEGKLMLTYQF